MADTPTGSGSNGGTTTVVSNPPNPPTTNTVPNTTTDIKTVEFQQATSSTIGSAFNPSIAPRFNGQPMKEVPFDTTSDNGTIGSAFNPGIAPRFNGVPLKQVPFDLAEDPTENVFDPGATYNGPAAQESVFDPRQDVGESVFDPGATINAGEESVFNPGPVDANNTGEGFGNVYPDGFGGFVNGDGQPVDANGSLIPTGDNVTQSAALVNPGTGGEGFSVTPDGNGGYTDAAGNPVDQYGMPIDAVQPTTYPPADVAIDGVGVPATIDPNFGFNPDQEAAASEAATRQQAKQQATYKARYGDVQRTPDWRVRLSLAPGAQYLYNDPNVDILKPLSSSSGTNGVIFPYTPNITMSYQAQYEQYDLVHSNYRGLFYKNSRVGDIQIRGTFTAQDTQEANYLLAVIHFFRSATKMFYGQDAQRGTPPPVCFLNGFGQYQFSNHPVVISSFNYTLPNDVDYIRTNSPNNSGLNLLNRYNQTPGPSRAGSGPLAGVVRLANALLSKGAQPPPPGPGNPVPGMVNNQTPASYVPTKMEIDITLIPAQSRSQLSKQFSVQGFANGDLLRGGFW